MNPKLKFIIAVAAIASAFSLGRYTVPEKVKVVTEIKEVEKKVDTTKTNEHKHEKTVTHTVKHPDGTEETTTTTTQDDNTKSSETSTDTKSVTENKSSETVRGDSKVTLSALAGADPFDVTKGVIYGASVTKPVLGPVTIGVWGLSDRTFGASVGLQF